MKPKKQVEVVKRKCTDEEARFFNLERDNLFKMIFE